MQENNTGRESESKAADIKTTLIPKVPDSLKSRGVRERKGASELERGRVKWRCPPCYAPVGGRRASGSS